jgi:hypothetical protein
MKETGFDESHFLFKMNGFSLLLSFFISRILFLGIILVFYVLPVFLYYDYDQAAQDIGWMKVKWGQLLLILFNLLYILNIFWFSKLI